MTRMHRTDHSMTTRRTLLRASAGAGFAFAAGVKPRPAHAATEKIMLQLDWIPFGRHAPYYAALGKGFYAERGLDVTITPGRGIPQGIQTLVAGQSQFLFNDLAAMMSARASQGLKIKALACMYQKSPDTLFYIKDPEITKPKDFDGKKIAYTPGDAPRFLFPAFAKETGIHESTIKWLSVDPNSKNAVLLNHQVQGMVTYLFTLPVLQKAAQGGDQVGTFVYSDFGLNLYSNGLGAMEEYIKAKPKVTRDFVQATMKGLKFTLAHPKEAVGILKKYQPQLDADVALQEVVILRKLTDADTMKTLGAMTKEKMEKTQGLLVKYLSLKHPINVTEFFTNEFLT